MSFFIYPVLLAIMPILFLTANNEVVLPRILLPVMAILAVTVVSIMFLLHNVFSLDYSLCAPVTCGLVLLFYMNKTRLKRFVSRYAYRYWLKTVVCVFSLYLISRFPQVTITIDVIIASLAFLFAISIFSKKIIVSSMPDFNAPAHIEADDCPDIYNIILDAYPGRKTFSLYGENNDKFYKELKERGFYSPKCAMANYNHTIASIPSIMAMNYTEEYLKGDNSKNINDIYYRYNYLFKGEAPLFLRSLGYKHVTTGEPMIVCSVLEKYKPYVDIFDRNNISLWSVLLKMTVLDVFKIEIKLYAKYINNILGVLSKAVSKETAPTFTFAHLLTPHYPYVFAENGKINKNVVVSDHKKYFEYTRYINTLFLDAVDSLIEKIKIKGKKAVILIYGDHSMANKNELTLLETTFVVYGYNIDVSKIFPDKFSFVNMYRYLFNTLFDTKYSILEDKYFIEHMLFYNDLMKKKMDVTEQINKALENV